MHEHRLTAYNLITVDAEIHTSMSTICENSTPAKWLDFESIDTAHTAAARTPGAAEDTQTASVEGQRREHLEKID